MGGDQAHPPSVRQLLDLVQPFRIQAPSASVFGSTFFEALYAKNMRKLTIPQAEHHQKRLDRAHRRHLSAIRALAQVRKLLKGGAITQINIADKQINTTG